MHDPYTPNLKVATRENQVHRLAKADFALRRLLATFNCQPSVLARLSSLVSRLCFFAGCLLLALQVPLHVSARPDASIDRYVDQFEQSYRHVENLQADFAQTSFAWGRTRIESGTVYLARGGRMRWVYHKPETKIFVTKGKTVQLYLPAEKQLRISSLQELESAPTPLDLLLSHIQLGRFFSRIEFAPQALEAGRGDRVIRCAPKPKYEQVLRSCLIEVTPSFDVRRLVIFYPDNSTMQFAFSQIKRNQPLAPSLFSLTPPPGTEVIRQ
jgi:outer membrane lipoprotein carrier protein